MQCSLTLSFLFCSCSGDEVWRPGGSIDHEPAAAAADIDNDGWGQNSPSEEQNNPFGSPTTSEMDIGWGSSAAASTSTWAPPPPVAANTASANQQQPPPQQDTTVAAAPKPEAHADMGDADESTAVWFMERVCVQLKSDGSPAVIKGISSNTATVEMEDKSTKTVRVGDVSMVPPKEHDQVLVIGGADVGMEGELVCIDGTDAILKDGNEEFRIVDFVHLAKIIGEDG